MKVVTNCLISTSTETFNSFQDALAAEMKLTARPPAKSYTKAVYMQPRKGHQQSTEVQVI